MPLQWIGQFGYYFDSETGALHIRRRSYSPTIARWSARDPALNERSYREPYVYAGNSPTSRVDPTGLLDWKTSDGPPPELGWGVLDDRYGGTRVVGYCGAFLWTTEWVLDAKETDGFIVQRVCPKRDIEDCDHANSPLKIPSHPPPAAVGSLESCRGSFAAEWVGQV